MRTKIEWTEETWNPVVGCEKISEGCKNCYAINMANRLQGMPGSKEKYAGTVEKTKGGKRNWTGKINLHWDSLLKPLKQKKPTMYFVNSMSDLFHDDVHFMFIDKVFAVMMLTPQHTYQILTKRPKRMLEWFNHNQQTPTTIQRVQGNAVHYLKNGNFSPFGYGPISHNELIQNSKNLRTFPLKNVWLGVSVENQKAADERIPLLLQVPAAVRWLSMEPLLGAVDLNNIKMKDNRPANEFVKPLFIGDYHFWPLKGQYAHGQFGYDCPKLDWVVVGGESGPGARPMHPNWARSLRDQCKEANVPFFFKQWGEYNAYEDTAQPPFMRSCSSGCEYDAHTMNIIGDNSEPGKWRGGKWMDVLDAAIYSEPNKPVNFLKVGKKKAGRKLDGVLHDEYPEIN